MSRKKTLFIIHRKYLVECLLFEYEQTGYKIKFKEKFPIIDLNGFKYTISEFILECLDKWGKDIGISLVEKKVPIISTDSKNGVSEIILFTKDKREDFSSITSNINQITNNLSQQGVKEITQRIRFTEMISVFHNLSDYKVVRYSKENASNVKVKSRNISNEWKKSGSESDFRKRINKFSNTIALNRLYNYFENSEKQISFLDNSIDRLLPELIYYWYLISSSFKENQMNISSFGQGSVKKNILFIGGDYLKYYENIPFMLICLLSGLKIVGNFTIYLDVFGLLEYVQSMDSLSFDLSEYLNSIVEFWGYGFSFNYRDDEESNQTESKVAGIEISTGDRLKEYTLKNGDITSIWSEMQAQLSIEIVDNYFLANKKNQIYDNICGNLFFDARIDPDKFFDEKILNADLIKGWMKTSKAFTL